MTETSAANGGEEEVYEQIPFAPVDIDYLPYDESIELTNDRLRKLPIVSLHISLYHNDKTSVVVLFSPKVNQSHGITAIFELNETIINYFSANSNHVK